VLRLSEGPEAFDTPPAHRSRRGDRFPRRHFQCWRPASPTIGRGEPRSIARTPDQIGGLISGKPLHDESHLIRAAQTALAKLGYAIKIDGVEGGDTRRALRDFERAHGLAITPEISSALVSQLTGAARMGRQRKGPLTKDT
jgi:hypothetical protein